MLVLLIIIANKTNNRGESPLLSLFFYLHRKRSSLGLQGGAIQLPLLGLDSTGLHRKLLPPTNLPSRDGPGWKCRGRPWGRSGKLLLDEPPNLH